VVDHLHERSAEAGEVEGEEPQHAEPQVADRGVRDQFLHVGLDHRHQRPVDDPDDGEREEERLGGARRLREERQGETEEPVGPELQEDPRQDDRARGRSLDVRVRQPGVQREDRHLDGEGEREGGEQPELLRRGEGRLVQAQQVEGSHPRLALVQEVERQDRHQHEERTDDRVEDELDRGVDPPRSAPDPDQQVHRDQHQLPEDVEEEDVERQEDAEHPRLQHEQEDVELLHPLAHRAEGGEDDQRREHGRQQHEIDGDAVDPEEVLDPEARDPGAPVDELRPRLPRAHQADRPDGEEEAGRQDEQGPSADEPRPALREEAERDRRQQRQEDRPGEDRAGVRVHPPSLTAA